MKRFSISQKTQEVEKIVTYFYAERVKERNRKFILDDATRNCILAMAEILTDTASSKFGVVLCGTFGNGKTTMLYAVRYAIHYLFSSGAISFRDFSSTIPIVPAKDIIIRFKNNDGYHELANNDILMIDDIGTEPKEVLDYGNISTPVIDLLENRYNRLKFTFLTTNLSPKELSEKYGPRLADRFREMFHIIGYDHPSYR